MMVHIVGLAGSGKTTLARWIRLTLDVPAYDLDWVVYERHGGERPAPEVSRRIGEIAGETGWVTEGAYHDEWLRPLLERADVIVWLDPPLPWCAYRMIKRHVLAEARRNNAHPGWRRLLRFLDYTRRTAQQQRRDTDRLLRPYRDKLARCRSSRDLQTLRISLQADRQTPEAPPTHR